jgi:hypothetical protein
VIWTWARARIKSRATLTLPLTIGRILGFYAVYPLCRKDYHCIIMFGKHITGTVRHRQVFDLPKLAIL